jgi:hypothetical protein
MRALFPHKTREGAHIGRDGFDEPSDTVETPHLLLLLFHVPV